MSCWRNCSSVIRNVKMEILEQAASRMGLGIDATVKNIGTSYGSYERNNAQVDGVFTQNGQAMQLGFRTNDKGIFEVVGDFYHTRLDSETFMGQLGQIYAEINIRTQLELQGYTVESVTTLANGDTEIEAYVWA